MGYIQCHVENQEQKQGCFDLRTSADPRTPGDNVLAGQTAEICLYPSADDFYQSIDNYSESLLSMLDTIKRLTNHEDFADISLPVFGNAEATFEKVEDP